MDWSDFAILREFTLLSLLDISMLSAPSDETDLLPFRRREQCDTGL